MYIKIQNYGGPGAIRTRDLPLRRRMLYPLSYKTNIDTNITQLKPEKITINYK